MTKISLRIIRGRHQLLINAVTTEVAPSTLKPSYNHPNNRGSEQLDSYSITILGNVEECRTEAEVSRDGRVVAIVYESSDGWHTEIVGEELTPPESDLEEAVDGARRTLSHYVNRLGNDPPQNATRGAFALWLMMKDDGKAMETALQGDANS